MVLLVLLFFCHILKIQSVNTDGSSNDMSRHVSNIAFKKLLAVYPIVIIYLLVTVAQKLGSSFF